MTMARQEFGARGEQLACEELERRGYRIVCRRYRTRAGEIDIVARDGDWLVFIEVKARQDGSFGDGAEAVTEQKQRRVVMMAMDYLTTQVSGEVPCRFDVVAIDASSAPPTVMVIEDAFRPGW